MKVAEVKKLVKLWVTPSLLREWADRMEKQWPKKICGESVIWHQFIVDNDVDIAICFDQESMRREYGEG